MPRINPTLRGFLIIAAITYVNTRIIRYDTYY